MGLFVQRLGMAWWEWASRLVFGERGCVPVCGVLESGAREEYESSMLRLEEAIQMAVLSMILSGERVPENMGDKVRESAMSSAWRALV